MNNNKIFSVLIPTYNRAHILPKAIESVLNQTFQNFELIISNNSSTDSTHEIISNYQKTNGNIKYFKQEQNLGISKNMKFCLEKSSGNYVIFLGDDDFLHKDFLFKIHEVLNIYNDIGIVYSGRQCVDSISGKISQGSFGNQIYYKNLKEWIYRDKEKTIFNISGVAINRSYLQPSIFPNPDDAGWGFDDYMYMTVIAERGAYGIKDILVDMTINTRENNVSNISPEKVLLSSRMVRSKINVIINSYINSEFEKKEAYKVIAKNFKDSIFIGLFLKKHFYTKESNLIKFLNDLFSNKIPFFELILSKKFLLSTIIMILPFKLRMRFFNLYLGNKI